MENLFQAAAEHINEREGHLCLGFGFTQPSVDSVHKGFSVDPRDFVRKRQFWRNVSWDGSKFLCCTNLKFSSEHVSI